MTIVPRWEWRTFGRRFGAVEDRLAALTPTRVEDSDEIYLLSPAADGSVKVRGDRMDAKRLERVDDDGLQRWRPVLKSAFPLSPGDVRTVLEVLGVDAPADLGAAGSLDELLAVAGGVTAVAVRKHREHHELGGCLAELSELRIEAGTTRTIAVEATDPALVGATVRDLGLGDRPNVCVARGLKRLAGLGPERHAVIDVGTNSVKFHIGERRPDGDWQTVVDRAEVTRLGEGLRDDGRLHAEPVQRTADAIAGMADEADAHGAQAITAVGTAGMRLAANPGDLIDAVRERCGVAIEVISGEDETRLAYLGAISGLGPIDGSLVVFDTGGGSSQFTFGHDGRVDRQLSLDLGAVALTERFGLAGAVSAATLQEALAAIAESLEHLNNRPPPDTVVGMGGAVTNLAAIRHELREYDPDAVQGTSLPLTEIDRQIALFRVRDADARRAIPGLQPARAEVILAGACVVRTVLMILGGDTLIVSDRGLRHGVLEERRGVPASRGPSEVPVR